MIPANEEFVENVAKSIAKNRVLTEAIASVKDIIKTVPNVKEQIEEVIDQTFDHIWNCETASDQCQLYRDDARAVIAAINMQLLMVTE